MDFQGMTPVSDGRGGPLAHLWGARGRSAIGAPSAWVFLGWLRPRRASFRFPRRSDPSEAGSGKQAHRTPESCLENPYITEPLSVDKPVTHVSE